MRRGVWSRHARLLAALRDSAALPFWLDDPARPEAAPPLMGGESCDLAVVGGGFTGLWTALLAKERDPSRDVVLLDAGRVAEQASGRNGGVCEASLTHGLRPVTGPSHREERRVVELGVENLAQIARTVADLRIDCGYVPSGEIEIATAPWHVDNLRGELAVCERDGLPADWLDAEALRAEVSSPTYLAGLWHHDAATVHPARLAWGLLRAARERGVRVYEGTPVRAIGRAGGGVGLATPWGGVRAAQAVLATNVFPPLLRRLRGSVVPVYDYVLVTEPLSEGQLTAIGWRRRQALADAGYLFHYYRLTPDDRILWGGWDVIYGYGSRIDRGMEERPGTFLELAAHFFATFPQLEGVRFTHRWAGAIDTCSRLYAFYGAALGGRVAYALGYTGLGVGASRFGARVALDLLSGERTELTGLGIVRSRPLPFPPEPLRFGLIEATRWSTRYAEEHGGRRNAWLRALDRLGFGFDS